MNEAMNSTDLSYPSTRCWRYMPSLFETDPFGYQLLKCAAK